uniref:G-protein coupled receptors family 1 profile domain-containing protein n=1 Tax=Onchocerca volvulus TaxID=6282 RepID=A0A8R1XPE4_ONCVO
MDFVVDKAITENVSIIANEERTVLTVIKYISRTYAHLIIGTMLILVNIPVSLFVIMRKKLREIYMILAIIFLNNGFTGISLLLLGMRRLICCVDGELISHHSCVLHIPVFLITAYLLNGTSLLINSLERFCAVAFPIYYYTHTMRINYSLITAQYVITIILITSTVVASLIEPSRHISNYCILQTVYSLPFYIILLQFASTASLLSIIVMIIVITNLKKKFGEQFLSNHSYDRHLSHFLQNQKRYTHTALISCCFTFCMSLCILKNSEILSYYAHLAVLVVVPSIVEEIYVLEFSEGSQIIVMCCVYLRLLNSFNMVVLFLYRQKDFRYDAVQYFKCIFCRQKHLVKPTIVVCFEK